MKLAVMWVIVGLLLTSYEPTSLAFQAFLGIGIFAIALMWKRMQFKSSKKINDHEE